MSCTRHFLRCSILAFWLVLSLTILVASAPAADELAGLPRILTHDNLVPAGQMKDGTLDLRLEIKEGAWRPDADNGPFLPVYAFGELGKPLSIPGPLIRVSEGTQVHVSVHNPLGTPVLIHGLHGHPGAAADTLTVPAGATREVTFKAGAPGTYFYWATTGPHAMGLDERTPWDTELNGAFIVDGPGTPTDDRILLIGVWYNWLVPFDFAHGFHGVLTINGRQWPHTTRLNYTAGDTAHWRVINASVIPHPMHMHGAYFRVDSDGNADKDDIYASGQRRMVNTELMEPGRTMLVSWTPEHSGNWIFHCHLAFHFAAARADEVRQAMAGAEPTAPPQEHDMTGMSGLVLGINVADRPQVKPAAWKPARQLTMTLSERPGQNGAYDAINVAISDGKTTWSTEPTAKVGPPLVVYRDQPTEITVVNHLKHPTAIHWHGIELESYYDGVPGVTGDSRQVTPPIAPGESFVARMAPPRAGTFIYHTHWHNIAQLTSGLYGALLVLDPGQRYDPATDKVFVIGRGGPNPADPVLINGSAKPSALELRTNVKYRFRFINITPEDDETRVQLLAGKEPARWTSVAKDGYDLPPTQVVAQAASQVISVGETYDFEFQPRQKGDLELKALYDPFHASVPLHVVEAPILSRK